MHNPSVINNFIYSVLYQVLSLVVPLFTIPYVSRVFGAEGLGIYSYTNAVAQYFVIFAMLGLNNYGVRTIAQYRDNDDELSIVFSQIYSMQFLCGLLSLAVYVAFLLLAPQDCVLLFYILLLQILSVLFDVNWFFFGIENFKVTVIRNSIIKIVSLICIFVFIKRPEDLWIYTLIYSASIFISAIILWTLLLKKIHFVKPQWKEIKKHFKPNIILFVPVVAISIYKYMDKIMLANYSMKETGYYDNVEKVLTVALSLVVAFGTVMLPRISNLAAKNDTKSAENYLIKSINFIMFLSVGIYCGMITVANEFVPLYFGEQFTPCVLIMQTMAITAVFSSWANVIRTQFLIPFNQDKIYVYSVIFGAVICFVLNLILIPQLAALGAVISTIAAEFVVAFTQTFYVRKKLPLDKMFLSAVPYLIFGLIMICCAKLVVIGIESLIIRLIFEILIGGFIYSLLSLIYFKKQKKWIIGY